MSARDADDLARLTRAARALLARPAARRGPVETGLALTALCLADRVSAASPACDDREGAAATARALRAGAFDTRAPTGEGAALHAALDDAARARLSAVNPRYLEALAREEGQGGR